MSDLQSFFKLSDLLFQLYGEGKYADALAVAEKAAIEYPEMDTRTAFWLICLQNMTGQPEKALQTFRSALTRGAWWAEFILRSDPDLGSLQGNEEFESLVNRSEEMHKQAEASARPGLFVHQPEGSGPFPLLICLHGRAGNPELDYRYWLPAIELGWLLAMPQSSQTASSQSYLWDDREKTFNEVEKHYDMLIEKYPVDPERIIVAGFSQGAARAIELVTSERVKARGFFAVVPGTVNMAELEGWAASHVGRSVLVSGGKDPRYAMFVQIKDKFEKHNIPLLFEHYPEMAHQIPDDFETVLQKGLNFIVKERE
ncbi:MAG: hypothetical protein QY306_14165 [Anaerolineales bacterium]|nr:MAG: hypothetical protein QY306_14165 [Anaerolineales bacterium]